MSSKRRLRQQMCGEKINHGSYAAAYAAAASLKRRTGERLHPYGCSFCGGVHIGHPDASARQSLRDRARAKRASS